GERDVMRGGALARVLEQCEKGEQKQDDDHPQGEIAQIGVHPASFSTTGVPGSRLRARMRRRPSLPTVQCRLRGSFCQDNGRFSLIYNTASRGGRGGRSPRGAGARSPAIRSAETVTSAPASVRRRRLSRVCPPPRSATASNSASSLPSSTGPSAPTAA